jgi:hypothetical protein
MSDCSYMCKGTVHSCALTDSGDVLLALASGDVCLVDFFSVEVQMFYVHVQMRCHPAESSLFRSLDLFEHLTIRPKTMLLNGLLRKLPL